MTKIKVGDLIKTSIWYGVVIEVSDINNYLIHWFFNDDRNPISWLDGYATLKYRKNVLTALGK
jgi:hypothetical protein